MSDYLIFSGDTITTVSPAIEGSPSGTEMRAKALDVLLNGQRSIDSKLINSDQLALGELQRQFRRLIGKTELMIKTTERSKIDNEVLYWEQSMKTNRVRWSNANNKGRKKELDAAYQSFNLMYKAALETKENKNNS